MLQNKVFIKGKLIKKAKIRDNFWVVTVVTNDYRKDKMNYPRFTCKTSFACKQLENIQINDYVEIKAHIGDRKIFNDDKFKTVGCLYIDEIQKLQSLAESFGFITPNENSKFNNKEFLNEFNLVGFYESSVKKGNRTYVSLRTPDKIILVDYNSARDYSSLDKNSLLCVKGVVQAGNNKFNKTDKKPDTEVASSENMNNENTDDTATTSEKKKSKYIESYVISQSESVSTSGLLRE